MSRLEDIRYCVETEEENYTMPFARQRAMAHRRYLLGLVDRLKDCLEGLHDYSSPRTINYRHQDTFDDYRRTAVDLINELEGTDGKQQD